MLLFRSTTQNSIVTSITTVARPTTCAGWLAALSECLTVEFRTDGTHYSALSSEAKWDEIRDDLQSIVREAHFGEMPNDWRYETVDSIATTLAEMPDCEDWSVENFQEESYAVAESLVDIYTGHLLHWIGGNLRRCTWDDEGIAQPTTDIVELIKLRQFEEIESMVQAVLSEIEQLIAA